MTDPLPHDCIAIRRFEHDCDRCVFLGYSDAYGQRCDVYVCAQTGWPTVLLRYGNEGDEYHSGAHLVDRLPDGMRDQAESIMADWRKDPRCV